MQIMLPVHRRDDVVRDLITSVTCTCVSSHPTPEMNYVNQLGDIFHGFICRLIACSGILQTGRHMHIHTYMLLVLLLGDWRRSFLPPPPCPVPVAVLLATYCTAIQRTRLQAPTAAKEKVSFEPRRSTPTRVRRRDGRIGHREDDPSSLPRPFLLRNLGDFFFLRHSSGPSRDSGLHSNPMQSNLSV